MCRSGLVEITNLISTRTTESILKISDEPVVDSSKGEVGEYSEFRERGLELVSKSKLAVVLILNSGDEEGSAISLLEALLSGGQEFIQVPFCPLLATSTFWRTNYFSVLLYRISQRSFCLFR